MSAYEFRLPDVGEGLSEGEIVRWHVAVGDAVAADQTLVDVQTDKAIVEIPSPVAGTVTSLGGQPGDILDIGAVLVVLEADGETTAQPASSAASAGAEAPASGHESPPPSAPPPAAASARVRASPATRKLARTLGVNLGTVQGSGSRGQITRQDVERAAAPAGAGTTTGRAPAPPVAPPVGEDRSERLSGLRRQIALNMETAWRNVPHIFTFDEVDATDLVRARRALNEELEPAGIKLSFLPFFVKACAAALQAHPRFNATLDMEGERIIYRHRYNIGIATATPDGLVVAVVHDADRKSLAELAEQIEALAVRARERSATLAELSGGTFTISNYGSYGASMGTPIIRPPEVAIAGFGRVQEAVVPVDGIPAVRTRLPFAVATDHRLNDGEHMGRFVATMTAYLRDPIRLFAR
jgi:pyruvate/2-oxoglutarate dehydrogenase complex dihydrolipoamide acyltransferase (E2) component